MVWGGTSEQKYAFFVIGRNIRGASSHDKLVCFLSLFGLYGRKLSLAEEGRNRVSE